MESRLGGTVVGAVLTMEPTAVFRVDDCDLDQGSFNKGGEQ